MRPQSEKNMVTALLVLGQLLVLWSTVIRGNSTMTMETTSRSSSAPNIAAIVAPSVILGVLAIVVIVLVVFFCIIRKKRQTEGTYHPSAEEQTGTRSVQAPDALKLPKEERLI
nr:protein crumbs homolog 3 [Paramormyrops kingsleyae]XP_023677732.1 protein crumbs homolog 3 [Paramormyrops kingsleyae]XP_023677733.1 protein crumbs homolog 3 [Paramormyrops kingsleyae]XP_023677734.1 protein crumbs homolog 3 [Paramormyrops kingsleyae]XP_023677735.1 protein crumbs homolog 3 [Paramormyrops kingsleyae]